MLIVKKTRKTETGFETTWDLSEEQMSYLVTFAINALLQEGLVEVEDVLEHSEGQSDLFGDALANLDETKMEKQ